MVDNQLDRFPRTTHIMELIDAGAPAAMTILGSPACQIRVYPEMRMVEALVRDDVSLPKVHDLKSITSRRVQTDSQSWNAVGATWVHSPFEAYLFVCDIIDRVQLMDETLATATDVVLQGMGALIRRQSCLSREAEIGLMGELLVLNRLIDSSTPSKALEAWLGPESEEHDFTLEAVDLEVKTTSSEERAHWITSAAQLTPARNRPLTLVSIQITPKMGEGSISLPKLVRLLEQRCDPHGQHLLDKLESLGYVDSDSDLYTTEWALRTSVACFTVDDTFPKITSGELSTLGLGPERITALRYRVSLTSVQASDSCDFSAIRIPGETHVS